ncbi:MAG TPA: 3-oxoacyl-ACP reductase FabG [Rickettsiales bacterium]|nr:3-oxoacyl-ACP reductase FabG [Rickettsiales bacterium]
MFNLTDKKVLITGASGGIGNSIAKIFSDAGAIVGLAARNEEKLKELASTLKGKSHIFKIDLGNLASVESFFEEVEKEMGGVDVLVCNAGITKDMLSMRMKTEDFQEVIDVNLTSTFVLNREACKKMMRRKFGRIINISSIVGVMGNAGQANYCASKAGMIGMTKAIAQEYASRGITINCIAPGFIKTPMTDVLTEEQKNVMLAKIPQGRFGNPEDIANTTVFLASNEASYITGQTIHVNGGMIMI